MAALFVKSASLLSVEGRCLRRDFPLLAQMTHVGKLVYSNADACAWAEEVADGLAYLHSYNPQVIHRDVKLDNVLLRSAPPQGSAVSTMLGHDAPPSACPFACVATHA